MQPPTDTTIPRLLDGLNPPQREAVVHTDGPLLILAGPGSGKTRVVTRRAAHLAATVTKPHHILAITFTNKAAAEMRERIEALGVARGMTVCTFHALCAKLLRIHADRADLIRNFTILDQADRRKLIKKAIEACDLSSSNWPVPTAERVISDAKNEMLTATVYASAASDWRERGFARIYQEYEKLQTETASLDFDDLLMRFAMLVSNDDELRSELEDRYRYVLIDEYQDTNAAQYMIARLLTREHKNLCATGDPDQSIYGWRGANIENILTFERDYPGAAVVRLEQNYRSTKHILAAADALIAGNTQRKEKSLWTENDDGALVRIVESERGEDEALLVARDIKTAIRGGVSPGDIAVLYRINSLSRVIEEALMREGVPYQIARGVEFYNRREIKDVLAYLRVLVNPADEIALLRIINTPPRGIGATTVQRMIETAQSLGKRAIDVVMDGGATSALGRSASKVAQFAGLLRSLSGVAELAAPEALARVIRDTGLQAHYRPETHADETASANLDELISAASVFHEDNPDSTLIDWLEHAALVSDVDSVQSEGGPVTLMTLHAAKGLEFPIVHIVGLEDGLLPMRRMDDPSGDDEEERRLCFVGITRAKARLTLSLARFRTLRGVTQRTVRSPFLDELPRDDVELVNDQETRSRRRSTVVQDGGRLPDDINEWTIGTLVRHPTLGLGQVMSLQRGAKRTHVDVLFESGARQSWVLEFADLERVDFHDVG